MLSKNEVGQSFNVKSKKKLTQRSTPPIHFVHTWIGKEPLENILIFRLTHILRSSLVIFKRRDL